MKPTRKEKIKKAKERLQTKAEEFYNALSHGLGAVLSVIALIFMLYKAHLNGNTLHIMSSYVFGISLILLYSASTLYHAAKKGPLKEAFHKLDHAAIYILIAGTYTPFLLVLFKGADGLILFFVVWALAIAGIIYKLYFIKKYRIFSTLFYLGMGWIIVLRLDVFIYLVSREAMALIIIGGLLYSVGVIFYLLDKVKYSHTIWHFFVLGGSACHFLAVYFYVL